MEVWKGKSKPAANLGIEVRSQARATFDPRVAPIAISSQLLAAKEERRKKKGGGKETKS
jgi:hypothetical protein